MTDKQALLNEIESIQQGLALELDKGENEQLIKQFQELEITKNNLISLYETLGV